MNVKSILLSLVMTLGVTNIYALPEIPSDLKEWESWAMDGYEKELCPELKSKGYNVQKQSHNYSGKTKICHWGN